MLITAMTILAATAGLADELALGVHDFLARTLAIGNLRLADVRLDLKLAQQTVDDDLRWSSPMPAMMVWPVSWLVETRKVGSSSASF